MSVREKVALITGVTGQDGSYLAEFLLDKGYAVHGVKRRASNFNTGRVDHLFGRGQKFQLYYGDLSDAGRLIDIFRDVEPTEIYNLGAQSHVSVSFDTPLETANVNALGALRVLEAVRLLGMAHHTRIYQASSSELFGKVNEDIQNETTPFYPRSPYSVAKLFAYWSVINYRDAYGFHASNGILFNHESARRGGTFVTRKITIGVAKILFGLERCLRMGNLDAVRDWGHAKDYVEMQC